MYMYRNTHTHKQMRTHTHTNKCAHTHTTCTHLKSIENEEEREKSV